MLATVANTRTEHLLHGGGHTLAAALTAGYQRAFLGGSGIALAGAILAAVVISSRECRNYLAWAAGATK